MSYRLETGCLVSGVAIVSTLAGVQRQTVALSLGDGLVLGEIDDLAATRNGATSHRAIIVAAQPVSAVNSYP